MTSALPPSVRLSWWGTAWLRGHVVADQMVDGVVADDAVHLVAGSDGAEPLVLGLGRLRGRGATGLGLALPVAGDPLGLGGPDDFNSAALAAGEAVVATGAELGLVPVRVGGSVTWTEHPAMRRQVPDVGEADRALRYALLEAADELARLDVARWRPEVADELTDLRHPRPVTAPPGVPPRCLALAGRGMQAMTIVELALEDDGGAFSASEAEQRRTALTGLERAGRRALVAACSPDVWPG
ncbi:MAG TPA: hypothetical protein VFY58_10915 [Nocardioides sp.]|nr:hypothetical protein [Nocardioides sp.]